MVTSSLIEPKEVDAERGVILEEIAMNEDDPSDLVHEAFSAQLFGDTPLGRPILGTVDSINSISQGPHRRALPGQVHAGPRWWSLPAGSLSTMTGSCRWSRRRSARC